MSVMVLIPIILIFFMFQRYFIKGSNLSAGLKE
jgi:multiple sugar transport system permease protein